ncbi:hypothetical protein [Streptacidiphilus sp. MAP5-3]|uniref:hypothetical protein n=1 Tax=unclassified Streptacidiphilus TaxID=2643834 RepID=UPI003510F547
MVRFSVPWTAIDRIGVAGSGRDAPVVAWFSRGNDPGREWLQEHGISPYQGGDGYVLCHPARVAYSKLSRPAILQRLRAELTAYAGAKHRTLAAPRPSH